MNKYLSVLYAKTQSTYCNVIRTNLKTLTCIIYDLQTNSINITAIPFSYCSYLSEPFYMHGLFLRCSQEPEIYRETQQVSYNPTVIRQGGHILRGREDTVCCGSGFQPVEPLGRIHQQNQIPTLGPLHLAFGCHDDIIGPRQTLTR